MTDVETPKFGTAEYEWWLKGVQAAREGEIGGMTDEAKQVYDCVQIMAQKGEGSDRIVWFTAVVFTCTWAFRARLKLAWRILWPRYARRWRGQVLIEKRDLWIGVFWDRRDDGLHIYLGLLPTVVVHLIRKHRS